MFITDIPGFRNDDVPPSMTSSDDRLYLENVIRKLSAHDSTIADLLASSQDCHFFEIPLRNKRINEEYIKSGQNMIDLRYDCRDLKAQLDDFLSTNIELATDPQITMLRAQLSESTSQTGSVIPG